MMTARRFRTILCPVDFSPDSRAALRYASAVARRSQGRLVVLFVQDPLLNAAAAIAYDARALAKSIRADLRRFVARVVGPKEAATVVDLVVEGEPAREIGKAVRRHKCDLVVIGTRGLGGAEKLFFGSTTERVLRKSDVPVLAVPASASRRAVPARSWPKQVLAALELGDRAVADARQAADVARWFGARLILVTVVPPAQIPSWLRIQADAHDRARVIDARKRLLAVAGTLGRRGVAIRVLAGDPAEQIASAGLDSGVGLIVLSLHARERLMEARQGSVTYRVLCESALPVLAIAHAAPQRSRK